MRNPAFISSFAFVLCNSSGDQFSLRIDHIIFSSELHPLLNPFRVISACLMLFAKDPHDSDSTSQRILREASFTRTPASPNVRPPVFSLSFVRLGSPPTLSSNTCFEFLGWLPKTRKECFREGEISPNMEGQCGASCVYVTFVRNASIFR